MEQCKIVHEDDNYLCQFEVIEGRLFLHADVRGESLSLSAVKSGRKVMRELKRLAMEMGFERLYAVTPSPHFIRLIDPTFEHIQHIEFEDKILEMVVWELKP